MIDRLPDTLPHRTSRGRAHSVETYGEEATGRVERVQPYLDSLDLERLKQLYGKVLEHQIKYAGGFLARGMDSNGSVKRQRVLNAMSVEIAEVGYWKGRDVSYEQSQPKSILERVATGELDRIYTVLAERISALAGLAHKPGIESGEKTKVDNRAIMVTIRQNAVGAAILDRRLGR